jgi:hypothetical protein
VRVKRFGDVIRRPEFKPTSPVVFTGLAGNKND